MKMKYTLLISLVFLIVGALIADFITLHFTASVFGVAGFIGFALAPMINDVEL